MSEYLTPDDISGASFETKRRGLDPDEVRDHLSKAAKTVSNLESDRDALVKERDGLAEVVESLQAELENQPTPVQAPVDLDEAELTERLGQDAARVLSEARAAAADRIAEAESEAGDITAAAEQVYAQRSAEADEQAERIRSSAEEVVEQRRAEANEAAAQILASAEAQAQQARTEGSSERELADADAARIIREAELTRRQILEDLARRRSAARRQIEQLRAGRERLLASHETVRRALDEISEELTISMSEARAAAETAGHSVSETTIEELEEEIETARLTGLLDTGPVPVVDASASEPVADPPAEIAPENTGSDDAGDSGETVIEASTTDEAEDSSASSQDASTEAEDSTESDGDSAEEPSTESLSSENLNAQNLTPDDSPAVEADSSDDESPQESEPAASTETADAPSALAPVVQLDQARTEVDTASHPARGREAGARTSEPPTSAALPSKKVSEAKDAKDAKSTKKSSGGATVTNLASASSKDASTKKDVSAEGSGEVEDLFASLRSESEKPAKKKTKKKPKAKTKSKKTKSSKSSGTKKTAPAKADVDSSELARRLKRVLADEQSKAMSTVKAAELMPSLDELLGAATDHCEAYWVVAVGEMTSDGSTLARESIDDLVSTIRRRVGDGLDTAGDDKEAAVSSLRSVYRGIKTQRVAEVADAVMRSDAVVHS